MASADKNLSSNGDLLISAQESWLQHLLKPETRLEIRLVNVSGRLRMPKNWSLSSKGLPEHLFYLVAEGGFEAQVDDRLLQVMAGDLIWIEPGMPFSFQLGKHESLVVWRFRLSLEHRGRQLPGPAPILMVSPAKGCVRWMEAIVDEPTTPEPWSETRLRGLLLSLSTEIFHAHSAPQMVAGEMTSVQKTTLLSAVESAGHRRLSIAELARSVQLSPDYFARSFRRSFGCSPRRWLVEQRLRQAALRLLESNLQVSEIAGEFGYPDVFSFSKQFKTYLGVNPLAYRSERGKVSGLV